jgi:hypothetical protein
MRPAVLSLSLVLAAAMLLPATAEARRFHGDVAG